MSLATGFVLSFAIIALGGVGMAAFLIHLRLRDAQRQRRKPRGKRR